MKAEKVFTTIDTHTGGNPTRTLIHGAPILKGKTMMEKMLDMKKNHDWIRKYLMYEPRGHEVMSGCILVEPCHTEADIGIIYIETGGYLPMCGHDTIGCCTALTEMGIIKAIEPITTLKIDTPAGLVEVDIKVNNGKAEEVSFVNVPSFLLRSGNIDLEEFGSVDYDIAYGGNFYGIINADDLNLMLNKENASTIVNSAIKIRNQLNKEIEVTHPAYSSIKGVTHIKFYSERKNHFKNTVVVPPGGIDRSPCGTGTSAKMALLYHEKKIEMHKEIIFESIVGSTFKAQIIDQTTLGDIQAVIPKITGSAWVMGMNRFFYQKSDWLNEGFLFIPPFTEEI